MKIFKLLFLTLLGFLSVTANICVCFGQAGSLSSQNILLPILSPQVHDSKECAASAVIRLRSNSFLVGSDEDNNLRLYSTTNFNKITETYSLATIFRNVQGSSILESPKTDIEGAALMDNLVYLIGSHCMNNKGNEDKPERRRIFAVEVKNNKDQVSLSSVGAPYSKLIEDLNRDSRYQKYHLDTAAKTGSKSLGGLSIEGLAQGGARRHHRSARTPLRNLRRATASAADQPPPAP